MRWAEASARRMVGEGDAWGLDRRGTWVLWRRESGFEGRDLEDRWEGRDFAIEKRLERGGQT
jgi:hypothetical protein